MPVTIQQLHTSCYISQHALITKRSRNTMGDLLGLTMPKTALVTGFEPFAGASLNPSQLVVQQLAMMNFAHLNLVTAVLPVEYEQATVQLLDLINLHTPDVVISLGQAEGRDQISIERVAINLADAQIADNSGKALINAVISPSGDNAYFSSLDIPRLVSAVRNAGIQATQSLSAGSFVCNYIFYQMQKSLIDKSVSSGFIHLPLVPEQQTEFPGKPSMTLEDQVTAISIILNEIAK